MGEITAIKWTMATWNPWHGCIKISPGCKFCYMYRDKERYGQDPTVVMRSKTKFNEPVKWKEAKLIFTCSWSDWFIEQADDWRDDAWDVIRRTPQHTYQILTKRPERIPDHLPADWGAGWPNVWLGVSVENQEYADKRIPLLLDAPAAVRFISAEPLLGAININAYLNTKFIDSGCYALHDMVDWVIVGGESGHGARPMRPDWARSLRDQCRAAGVPFFFKQVGGVRPDSGGDLLDGERIQEMPFPRED